MFLARCVPKEVAYWVLIRAWAKATTGAHGSEDATGIKMESVIRRFKSL